MALGHGAKIVKNGLVFAYDMGNTQKSWKGAPATNIIYASPTWAGDGANQGAFVRESVLVTDDSLTYQGLQTFLYSPGASLNCYLQGSGADFPSTASTQWTFSCYVKREDGAAITSMSVYMYYPSSDGSAAGTVENVGDGWYRIYRTRTGTSNAISLAGFTGMAGSVKYYLSGAMLTATTVPVAALAGTASRSNTEALLDWTGNNTITADSLIYDSDGTFRFDGTTQDNRCTITPSTELSSLRGTTGITVESWVNYSSYSGGTESYSVITCWGAPWVWLVENPSSRLRFRITAGGADVNIADTSNHALNTWIQVVGTYDGATKKIYVNGVLKNSSAQTGVLGSPGGTPKIGTYQGTNYCMSGKIGDVKIYDRALTADEVTTNFNALRGRYGI